MAGAVAVATMVCVTSTTSDAAGRLAPHRAVYDMKLDAAGTSSGIAELVGRMVFEFRGSRCEGYTQSMRLVTKVTDRNGGGSVSDMRTSSWEAAAGEKFRFNSTTLRNSRVREVVSGRAEKKGEDGTRVTLRRPSRSSLTIDENVMFPVRHTQALLDAAHNGTRIMQANVYDGSEKGQKYYATTSVVGREIEPDTTEDMETAELGLSAMKSWPVSISYYEADDQPDEGLPTYQMAFRFFENGVTRDLKIDYGTFSVDGTLSRITYFDEKPCDAAPAD